MSYNAILFDIDGTLVNNVSICMEAYRVTLRRFGGRVYADDEFVRHFGMAEEGILAIHVPAEQLAGAVDTYFQVYEDLHRAVNEPFAGLREVIEQLQRQSVPVGVVTGKGQRGAESTLRMLGLAPYLRVVETGFLEGANKPESLRRAADRLGLPLNKVVYVGDTGYDIMAASSIGMPVVGAAWAETTTLTPENSAQALHVFRTIEAFHQWAEEAFCAPEIAA